MGVVYVTGRYRSTGGGGIKVLCQMDGCILVHGDHNIQSVAVVGYH